MARPVSLGLDVSFLARHTQDVGLIESLYQNSAENVLSEDTSLQRASYIVYMDHTNNDYLPSASSSGNTLARVPDAGSSGLPPSYSFATGSNGADSGLVRLGESTSTSQYGPVSANNNTLNTAGDQVASQVVEPCCTEAALKSVNSGRPMLNTNFGTNSVESTINPQLLALEQHVERPREEREREEQRLEREEPNRWIQLLCSPTEVPLPFANFTIVSLESNPNSAAEFWRRVDQARARMQDRERERQGT
ncbi:hypothetical protein OS493_006147 [Desmophyllum pertusum]|uniref:Uncharacterized protein n=1 Tax=Desmophyllum pertusum TaxID=174260 RepID=A0A9X0A4C0_9CNID|nr:hypothetical protein OS493_006147 [Desmophyllum pertusum]